MNLARALRRLARPWDRARLVAGLRRIGSAAEPFDGARAAVRAELAPFAGGVSPEARARQWRVLCELDARHALRVVQRGGAVTLEGEDIENVRARELRSAVELVARALAFPDFELLACVGDRLDHGMAHAPVLVFCRRRETLGQILIPDFEALRGYETLERAIDRACRESPWEGKRKVGFWRGAPTGGRYDRDGWRELPRARLVTLSLRRPDLLDARFTSRTHGAGENAALTAEGYFGEAVPPERSLGFRYLVDIDGNAASWSRVVWTLRSNSLLVKQASPYVQWFYPWLEAGRHYEEIAPDLADLESAILRVQADDDKARAIAEAGSRFARERLGRMATLSYLATALRECSQLG